MGFYGTMNALAMAVAPAIGVSAYQTFGYRASFVIALVFSVAIIAVIQFIGDKGEPEKEPVSTDEEQKRIELIDVKVIPIALIIMLFAIPYCATQSFLVTYAETHRLQIFVRIFFNP